MLKIQTAKYIDDKMKMLQRIVFTIVLHSKGEMYIDDRMKILQHII